MATLFESPKDAHEHGLHVGPTARWGAMIKPCLAIQEKAGPRLLRFPKSIFVPLRVGMGLQAFATQTLKLSAAHVMHLWQVQRPRTLRVDSTCRLTLQKSCG